MTGIRAEALGACLRCPGGGGRKGAKPAPSIGTPEAGLYQLPPQLPELRFAGNQLSANSGGFPPRSWPTNQKGKKRAVSPPKEVINLPCGKKSKTYHEFLPNVGICALGLYGATQGPKNNRKPVERAEPNYADCAASRSESTTFLKLF